ncbi:hypothetical protein [uncultured Maricaulis sp.]|uniref:hypothetical protein n=1 Tax=uncultured Maricaulis sp. TaxID=174710 RepID=UPI0030DD3B5C|tara:strand:+ start:76116 stop:77009 length:894 start_codon:yes stop_codon:yes gene_type:complete
MSDTLAGILDAPKPPALFIGNGINRHRSVGGHTGWENLLEQLAKSQGMTLTERQLEEMSKTEVFDILDLARPKEDRASLQREFCNLMKAWKPKEHHRKIVDWASRHSAPIITVNFDQNLSGSIGARLFLGEPSFTDFYPWGSYYSSREIDAPISNFAIWHPHGMVRYSRSIRLGLTHYMGSVQRARLMLYGKDGLRAYANNESSGWRGENTWLAPIFFAPLLIFGFGLGKDESFLRWLFLERAKFHKIRPDWRQPSWYVTNDSTDDERRGVFFKALGIELVNAKNYDEIYENAAWNS